MHQLGQARRCPVQGVLGWKGPPDGNPWPGLAPFLGRHAKCAAGERYVIAPTLRHLCSADFAQEVEKQWDHFDLMGIGVNYGMPQFGSQLVDLGSGFEQCRHDFPLLTEASRILLLTRAHHATNISHTPVRSPRSTCVSHWMCLSTCAWHSVASFGSFAYCPCLQPTVRARGQAIETEHGSVRQSVSDNRRRLRNQDHRADNGLQRRKPDDYRC